jgi:SET domain-containing protein
MVDDDLYDMPENFIDLKISEELCMIINHSCEPNLGFSSEQMDMIAIRDIEVGEEIAYDYQYMETEATFYEIKECKCGSKLCRKDLLTKFDIYRNVDWQNRYYKYCGEFVKRKIDELKTKWFSTECYLKNYNDEKTNQVRILRLTSLHSKILKNTMIAKFRDKINPDAHYIRQSESPNCYLVENEVFTLHDIEPYTELTLNYNLDRSEKLD